MTITDQASGADIHSAPLSKAEADALRESLTRLVGGYASRSQTLAGFVQGLLAVSPAEARLPRIAAAAGLPEDAMRRALDEFDEDTVRAALVRAAPAERLCALALESSSVTIEPGDHGCVRHILSLHAHNETSAAMPIGWAVVDAPPKDSTEGLLRLECEAIIKLLAAAAADYRSLDPSAFTTLGRVPVVILDPWYGTDGTLRAELAKAAAEYAVVVEGYDAIEEPLHQDPYETLGRHPTAAELFEPLPEDSLPQPREIIAGPHRHGREYVAATSREGTPQFAIVRPFIASRPHVPLGHRPQRRAKEIMALAAALRDTHAAERLRLTDFRHPSPDTVRRVALLASVIETIRAEAAHAQT